MAGLEMTITENGQGSFFELDLSISQYNRYASHHWVKRPKYLIKEIKEAIKAKDTFHFYEHDREGNKRFDNLRYTDKERIIQELKDYSES